MKINCVRNLAWATRTLAKRGYALQGEIPEDSPWAGLKGQSAEGIQELRRKSIPDMLVEGPHGVAAKNLFTATELAGGGSLHDDVKNDLAKLTFLINNPEDDAYNYVFTSPIMDTKVRWEIINLVLQKIEASPITAGFVQSLVEEKTQNLLVPMATTHYNILKKQQNEVEALIKTVEPLSDLQREKCIEFIRRTYVGRTAVLHLEEETDEAIVGGYTLQVGDMHVDRSVAPLILEFRSDTQQYIEQDQSAELAKLDKKFGVDSFMGA